MQTQTLAIRRPSPTSDRAAVDQARITAVALRLFAEYGYRATTMADIASEMGIRGPSLYKHIRAKHEMLGEIMVDTMHSLIALQRTAIDAGGNNSVRLRRVVETHVRYHATHRERAFVGNREIGNLRPPHADRVLALRDAYEHN